MKTALSARRLAVVATLGLIAMTPALADSEVSIGTNASASASVDFRVNIPQYISFSVGSVTAGTVDLVEFDVADPSTGTAVASNGSGLAVSLFGNVGDIQIEAATSAPTLLTADSFELDWGSIDTVSSDGLLDAPDLGTLAPVTVTPTAGRVVNRTATWTYSYANASVAGAGTYDGTVTYTASAP